MGRIHHIDGYSRPCPIVLFILLVIHDRRDADHCDGLHPVKQPRWLLLVTNVTHGSEGTHPEVSLFRKFRM